MQAGGPLTQLLALAAQGERGALDQVFATLYPELRKIAHARLYSQGGVAEMGTTVLVHESFLHFVAAAQLVPSDRKHFFAYAAKTMRNIIIDAARAQLAERRGGGESEVSLDSDIETGQFPVNSSATFLRVNDCLLELEHADPELAQVVEMRYFAGYTEVEIADLLGCSERWVRRQWEKARAFLVVALRN